jgi:hypothetical protein
VLPLAGIAVAALLWYCTAMIYACLRFIEEWSHPLTVVNYTLTGSPRARCCARRWPPGPAKARCCARSRPRRSSRPASPA